MTLSIYWIPSISIISFSHHFRKWIDPSCISYKACDQSIIATAYFARLKDFWLNYLLYASVVHAVKTNIEPLCWTFHWIMPPTEKERFGFWFWFGKRRRDMVLHVWHLFWRVGALKEIRSNPKDECDILAKKTPKIESNYLRNVESNKDCTISPLSFPFLCWCSSSTMIKSTSME